MKDLRGHKQYLGDGVYVTIDERGLVLTTETGESIRAWRLNEQDGEMMAIDVPVATNTIVLESDTLVAFERFVAALRVELERGGGR